MQANRERGEVPLRVGGEDGVDIVIALTMEGLAKVSSALGTRTINDLYQRLVGFEPACVLAAIDHLTVDGDKAAARRALKLTDVDAWTTAITAALTAHVDPDADEPGDDGPGDDGPDDDPGNG